MGCAGSTTPSSLQAPSEARATAKVQATKRPKIRWDFSEPYPSGKKGLGKVSIAWPCSFEIHFKILQAEKGSRCSRIFQMGGFGAKDECCLYTNTGGSGSGQFGSLSFLACSRKYFMGGQPFQNGDSLHVVCTFDGRGSQNQTNGKLWVNGQLRSNGTSAVGGSKIDAPVVPVKNIDLYVGWDQGTVEIYNFSINTGTVLVEDEIQTLYKKASHGTSKIGGAVLSRVGDEQILGALQNTLLTNPDWLGKGRDVTENEDLPEVGRYKKLDLVRAWQVSYNIEGKRYEIAKEELKQQLDELKRTPAQHKLKTVEWASALRMPLDEKLNECVALHGTSADVLPQILRSGLSERYSSGTFGDGTYLAEDAGKADQYCHVDAGVAEAHKTLHNALYPEGDEHPGNVCYMLVLKVLLGEAAVTRDGHSKSGGGDLWANAETRRELGPVPDSDPAFAHHSLLVATGEAIKRYREVVMFQSDRILIQYLVAYRRQ